MERIYLAGPDVFFPDPIAVGQAKKEICQKYGFEGCFPLDNKVQIQHTPACAFKISTLNEELLASCDLVVANLSPFRGVSADPGTVFEIGYAAGLGKGVHGYSVDPRIYVDRVRAAEGEAHGTIDHQGYDIENFGLSDNLMIQGAIHRRGGIFLAEQADGLFLFEKLIAMVRR